MLDRKIVGKNIASYRKRKGITQKELAELLNITAQSVSKWEAGSSMPTVDILYDLALVLNVHVDSLLSEKALDNRDICYRDSGLDVAQLYAMKAEVDTMVTASPELLHAHYIDPVIFQPILANYKEPVFALTTNVPGSKARLARERGHDKEICEDVTVRAINNVLRMGLQPKILQAHVVCGNKEHGQLREMATGFKETCEKNGVIFGGMEIACQPVNFRPSEYEVSVGMVGAADRSDVLTGEKIREGDVLIGMMTEGIEASTYPFIRIMLDRRPELAYEKIDDVHYFVDEILKPNTAFTYAVSKLQKEGIVHGICGISNSILYDGPYYNVPEGLGVCIDLSAIPIKPLFRFLQGLDMVGKNFFPYRFGMGISMIVIVPKERAHQAVKIIERHHECCVIGKIDSIAARREEKVRAEGKIQW